MLCSCYVFIAMCLLYVMLCVVLVFSFATGRMYHVPSTSCIMFLQHDLRHDAFLVWNLGYMFAVRDEMRTDFWSRETDYAKFVKNVSELRKIMWYALPCVNSAGVIFLGGIL